MPEQPKLVELQDGDYYISPDVRDYDSLLPQEGTRKARIRLLLLNAATLDIPMSEAGLALEWIVYAGHASGSDWPMRVLVAEDNLDSRWRILG